ncbi:Protein of unknown function [Propionibacterium freudenreichii subsp. freudenreichii]|uniref:Metallo-beta-lactamase domain-containing protein n=1 Tax=Propionibacterium freudenreichii subsp. freudenreichii TaxID=66712 RepID=A0A0B7NZG9_PROFF|nr:Protein of unknown function [Propionibacterium freudenreichii subsp. freudenreichii]SBN42972.1 Hypothetical protein PFR_J18_634 [Propionibacterium freudenreichii]
MRLRIETINVGDGACAVTSDTDKTTDLTLIDCGRWRRGDRAAADRARDYLGERLGDVTTLVVTHFDRDHWGGLLELAATHATLRPKNAPAVEIRIPGMPDSFAKNLRAGMLALISSRDDAPVNAIELHDAWKATGVGVRQTVHYAGDEFEANGRTWKVLWPPHRVPTEMGDRITTWLDDLKKLADEMNAAGHGKLLDDLRKAYAGVESFDASVAREESPREEPMRWPMPERHYDEHRSGDDLLPEDAETAPDTDFREVPKKFKDKLRKLANRMSSLDNALSLVITTEDGGFIDFGDIEGDALEALLRSGTVATEYTVMFAPHHGTHEAPSGLPQAWVCISQNGVDHHRKNFLHRKTHSNEGRCVSTWDRGNIDLDTVRWGFRYWPWW